MTHDLYKDKNERRTMMLELNHVGYTTEDGMEILHDITLKIDERFVAVT